MQENKTYEIIESPRMMSHAEMKDEYKGYWVFLVNVRNNAEMSLIEAKPVIKSTKGNYDGIYDGIYEQFDLPEYGTQSTLDLTIDTGELFYY